jgi:hypothetical protein
MADEITARVNLRLVNGVDKFTSERGNKLTTQATARPDTLFGQKSINVSSDAALTFPIDAADLGLTLFENLDADPTKYIAIGKDVSAAIDPFCRVYGGGQALVQLVPSASYRVEASAGTQVLLVTAVAK